MRLSSSDMDLPLFQRISGTSDIKKSKKGLLFLNCECRPNEDPDEVHAVETILKDIIDVILLILILLLVWVR